MGQVKPQNQAEVFSKLVSDVHIHEIEGPPSIEDIKFGYNAIVYCPIPLVKLFAFVDQLLSNESTRTIVQTLVSLFQSGAITDEASFTLAKRTS